MLCFERSIKLVKNAIHSLLFAESSWAKAYEFHEERRNDLIIRNSSSSANQDVEETDADERSLETLKSIEDKWLSQAKGSKVKHRAFQAIKKVLLDTDLTGNGNAGSRMRVSQSIQAALLRENKTTRSYFSWCTKFEILDDARIQQLSTALPAYALRKNLIDDGYDFEGGRYVSKCSQMYTNVLNILTVYCKCTQVYYNVLQMYTNDCIFSQCYDAYSVCFPIFLPDTHYNGGEAVIPSFINHLPSIQNTMRQHN